MQLFAELSGMLGRTSDELLHRPREFLYSSFLCLSQNRSWEKLKNVFLIENNANHSCGLATYYRTNNLPPRKSCRKYCPTAYHKTENWL